jgi:hypothetical protein
LTGEGPVDLAAVSRAMQVAYGELGGARMVMWLSLAGWRPRGAGMLRPLIDRLGGTDEIRRQIALLNAVHVAQAIVGEALMRAADLDPTPQGQADYLAWATEEVAARL